MRTKWKYDSPRFMSGLFTLILVVVMALAATPAHSHDRTHDRHFNHHHPDIVGLCVQSLKTGELSRRCFDRLVELPEVAEVLNDRLLVPGLADGRLSIHEISHWLLLAESVPVSRRPGYEPDPEDNIFIDRNTLDELRRTEQFDIASEVLTREGPIPAGKFVQPADGFPPIGIPPKPHLDIPGFTLDLHNTLAANVNGYVMRLRKDGVTVATLQWNWARNPVPADAPAVGWNTNRRIHVASVSKFMTAIGLVKMLKQKGIPTNTKIITYLPAYWNPGPNVDLIDFEDLLNHLSGFSTGGSSATFATIKAQVEAGVTAADVGNTYDYENMNFGLIRILMATIGGYINPGMNFGFEFMNDIFWNIISADAYRHYMETQVFNPHGAFPLLYRTAYTALANRYNATTNGWNSGSFTDQPGGYGWHMTVNEILNIARALRTGQIIGLVDAQELLNESWGLNSPLSGENTDAGRLYYKPGKWTDNINTPALAHTEQCVLLMAPDSVEIVVFVNSEIGPTGQSLQNLIRTLYVNHIVGP